MTTKKISSDDGTRVFSRVLPNGVMLETIYSPTEEETYLIVNEHGGSEVREDYIDEKGTTYLPISGGSDLLTKGFVKLASAHTPYDGPAKMYEQVKDFIAEFVVIPPDFLAVSSVYILLTWVFDRYQTLPYLRVIGDHGTGKSRFLQVIGGLCYKSIMASGSTSTAAVFRTLDQVQGTFCFDEADFRASDMWSEVVKILNAGHTRGAPVTRMDVNRKTNEMKTQTFNVYAPVMVQ